MWATEQQKEEGNVLHQVDDPVDAIENEKTGGKDEPRNDVDTLAAFLILPEEGLRKAPLRLRRRPLYALLHSVVSLLRVHCHHVHVWSWPVEH